MKVYNVLTPVGTFAYKGEGLVRGDVVSVPVRNSRVTGVVVGEAEWEGEAREVYRKLDIRIPEEILDLIDVLSPYYLTPPERFLPLILPPSLQKRAEICYRRVSKNPPKFTRMEHIDLWEYLSQCRTLKSIKRRFGKDYRSLLRRWAERGHVKVKERYHVPKPGRIKALEYADGYALPEKPTPEQERVLYRINGAIRAGKYRSFLLWGETGSGKTFVYIKAAEEAVKEGKSVLILVPEILLSYHLARAFYEAFGERFAVFHSGITAVQRAHVWFAALEGNVKVVMAVKSGVFVPLRSLGLVIVDEEHEGSFKEQDRPPLFNARDVAVLRAYRSGAVAVLGSATPSLESYHNVVVRKYVLLRLRERIYPSGNARIEVVDMRRNPEPLSETFREELARTLKEGKNAIVFLNRRGLLPYYYCEDCGNPIRCINCDTVLALHRDGRLKCHVCGYSTFPPATCPVCRGPNLKGSGTGTQRVEDLLREEYGVPVARLDTDSVRRRRDVIRILEEFGEGKVRILVGTKMVVKGLDFRNVGFVGVLNADSFLSRPADFRAEEKTYQTLMQVVGRIRTGGVAVIQTRMPYHRVIKAIIGGTPERIYGEMYASRRSLALPPFRRMAVFEVRTKEEETRRRNEEILADFVNGYDGEATLWGPYYPSISRLRGWYRVRVTVLSDSPVRISEVAEEISRLPLKGQRIWDVDPYDVD